MLIFVVKAFATYGSTVMLSWIGNRIVAENQRRFFDKLLHENIGFFADRHSSEFVSRLTTGAQAVSQVINILVTAFGRDLMSLIGLTFVMVIEDPVMSIAALVIAPPALLILRKMIRRVRGIARMQFTGSTRIAETVLEALQGMRMVKAFGLEDEMRRRLDESVASVENEFEQNGAGRQPHRSDDGRARRLLDLAGDDLRRLSSDRDRSDARPVRRLSGRVPCLPMSQPSGWLGSTSTSTTTS